MYLGVHEGPMDFTRECVLKLVPAPGSAGDLRSAEELAQEARVCSKLSHPAIVRMHDFFEQGEHLVLVFEHFAGVSLARLWSHMRRRKQQLGDDAIWYIAHSLFSALQHAHSLCDDSGAPTPVIHRDVQPAHIVMSADAQVRLAGFGIAKISGAESNTAVGFVKGTPAYMAPEQARGEKVTQRVDVFAAGLVVWEMLTSRTVVPGPDVGQGAELLALIGGRRVEPLSNVRRDLPRELVAAVDACLEFSPSKRQIRCGDVVRWIDKLVDLNAGRADLRERLVQVRNAALRSPPSSTAVRSSMAPPASTAPRASASRYPGVATRMTGRAGELSEGEVPPRSTHRVPPVMAPPSSSRPPASDQEIGEAQEPAPAPAPAAGRPASAPVQARRGAAGKGTLLGLAPATDAPIPTAAPAVQHAAIPPMPPPPVVDESAAANHLRPPPGVRVQAPPAPTQRAPAHVVISHVSPGEQASSGDTTVLTRRSEMFGRSSRVWLVVGLFAAVTVTAVLTAGIVARYAARPAPVVTATSAPFSSAQPVVAGTVVPAASAPPAAASVALAPAASSAAFAAATVPAPEARAIPRGLGVLIVRSPPEGTVYVWGVPVGETNERLEVACGHQKFVRVGTRPGSRGLMDTSWLAPGQSVLIRCGEVVEVPAKPRYSTP